MAKLKKSAIKKTTAKPASKPGARKTAGRAKPQATLSAKSISESAQQIWLAGMGAFNRAQSEGSKLFETLVRDGLSLEQTARKFAGSRAGVVRDAMEGQVGQARERAADTWDKLEKVFEDRVQRALTKLGVPGRDDLSALTQRVERLISVLRNSDGAAPKATKATKAKKATKATKPANAAPKAAKPAPKVAKPARKAASKVAKPAKPAKVAKVAKPVAAKPVAAKPAKPVRKPVKRAAKPVEATATETKPAADIA